MNKGPNEATYYPEIPKQMNNLSSISYYAGNSSRFNTNNLQQIYRCCNVQQSSVATGHKKSLDKYDQNLSHYILLD